MKAVIITVAGTATRFNRDTEEEVLKCLYYNDRPENSLLYQILQKADGVDQYIIVGGYLYDKLVEYVDVFCQRFRARIKLVYNDKYNTYGSGYSLIKGIEAISWADEVIFVEGDLFFDSESFENVLRSEKDVVTVNRELILADKAVVLYVDQDYLVRYIYDVSHKLLNIPVAFRAVYNSAQIWKFLNFPKLKGVVSELTDQQVQGTNLEIIQGYYGNIKCHDISVCVIEEWENCNTVADYLKIYSKIENDNLNESDK